MKEQGDDGEVIRWQAYPSWNQFAWLFFFSMGAALRSRYLYVLDPEHANGAVWLGGAVLLLACAGLLRYWAQFVLTSRRVLLRNGYTGRDIEAIPLEEIREVTVTRGPFAGFLGIGTVVVRSTGDERVLLLRGVRDPDAVKTRIDAGRGY